MQVGLDTKAILEAWNAIQRKHPELSVFIVTADAGTIISVCHVDCSHMRLPSNPAHLSVLLPFLPDKMPDSATALKPVYCTHAHNRSEHCK